MAGRDLLPIDPKRHERDRARVERGFLGALAYFVLPADLIPDFIAGLGFTDDAAVVAAAIRSVAPAITERHRDKARAALSPGGPRREAA
jgi:uncharacterized membrane protein YkvA (DUF1232 family)